MSGRKGVKTINKTLWNYNYESKISKMGSSCCQSIQEKKERGMQDLIGLAISYAMMNQVTKPLRKKGGKFKI